jgi:hypothetical protein
MHWHRSDPMAMVQHFYVEILERQTRKAVKYELCFDSAKAKELRLRLMEDPILRLYPGATVEIRTEFRDPNANPKS